VSASGESPPSLRTSIERRSHVLLVFIAGQPRWQLPVVMVALLAGTVLLPTVLAAVCLVVLLATVGWLSYLSWPVTDPRGRLLRVVALIVVAALGLREVVG
jgi:hypothetical protein